MYEAICSRSEQEEVFKVWEENLVGKVIAYWHFAYKADHERTFSLQ